MGMNTGGKCDARVVAGHGPAKFCGVPRFTDDHDAGHAGIPRAANHLGTVVRKGAVAEVAVRVDQHGG